MGGRRVKLWRETALRRLAGLWLILALGAGIAGAQAPAAREPVTVGVFGDSLADGLWMGLRWHLRADARVREVVQRSRVSTGLTNWVYHDVAETLASQLEAARYDIAVVMFGSNDMQGIRKDGRVFAFRSPGWEEIYRARIQTVTAALHDHGAQVIWVGLPVMRSAGYDANVRHINEMVEEEALLAGADFIETRSISADAGGGYSGYLPDRNGIERLVRADDGIHFTLAGYRRLALPVVRRVEAALADPALGRPPEPEPAEADYDGLVQLFIEGEPYLCAPASPDEIDAALSPPPRRSLQ